MPRINPQIALAVILTTFVFVSFILYSSVDSDAERREVLYNKNEQEFLRLKQKIQNLGKEVEENANVVNGLEHKLDEADKQQLKPVEIPKDIGGGKVKIVHDALQQQNKGTPSISFRQLIQPPIGQGMCPSTDLSYTSDSSIQMLQAYEIIPFDNINGGVWKQGWEITYDSKKILQEKKLEIVVVPHSHNDPGWLETFEGYFQTQTKNILDSMLKFLPDKPDMKFIYAEMSFFELWWSNLKADERKAVKKLLDQGQFEIVTGAWVMTDEANAHYYSTVMEMLEGHEFLVNQLDYRPTSHWSIDPFGLSPILTYVVKAGNLSHAAVQRVHYSVKKYLAQKKNLEFKWRQLWAGKSDKTDIFTHMFPFYSYDVPHTCGPDPKICCQFDFLRMFQNSCPWGVPPKKIDSQNVAQRATMLADQYRKKAQLYKTNVLLIPLGDDFRYSTEKEWDAQHSNYIKLFEQMNADTNLNIHARFGTLHDYFSLLEKRQAETEEKDKLFETLSGDFFTYADRDDHYWSGYFTSRPFYKHMDRSLQHYLRSADIAFTIANWKAQSSGKEWIGTKMYDSLVDARRAMSLFQHHDGVTGTAKDLVVIDYGEKMVAALNWCKMIIASAAEYLLKFPQTRDQGLKVDEEHSVDQLPIKSVVEDGGTVVIHNSLGYERSEVVCIYVSSFKSSIAHDESDNNIPQQIGPVLSVPPGTQRYVIDKDKFELCFVATTPAFGFSKYKVFEAEAASSVAKVESSTLMESSDFDAKVFSGSSLELSNEMITAKFNPKTGFLEKIKLIDGYETPTEMSFIHYGARGHGHLKNGGDDLSGAYLFLPDGQAKVLSAFDNSFVIVDGPIRKSVYVKGPKEILLTQSVSIDINNPALLIKNQVDIRSQGNFEAAMRLKTGIIDGENFYTDLNGYQMIKRKRYEKLPLQAHFYPMPASAFIENDQQRLSLLGRQALGVASLEPGWMEVMLDRRLDQDDGRGLAQPVHDNHRTESSFRLLLEDMETKQNDDATIGYHSLSASIYSNQLHYPPTILIGQLDHAASSEATSSYSGLERSLPCDIHPVALRTLSLPTVYGETGTRATSPQNSAAFILHRLGIECRTKTKINLACEPVANDKFSLKSLFADPLKNVRQASLTLLYVDEEKEVNDIEITPMELKTVKLNY